MTSRRHGFTIQLPVGLTRRMRAHPKVAWDEVIRRLLAQRVRDSERIDALTHHSALTREDVMELDPLIKDGIRRRMSPPAARVKE